MDEPKPAPGTIIARHRLSTRLWHWTNALAIFTLLGSGMMISNAHPHLYWGQFGANPDTPWLHVWRFPNWLTIPSNYNLALARRWHLFFSLIFAFALLGYMITSLINRHFQRDLVIRPRELGPAHLWTDIKAHLAFKFHDPAHPGAYNILQKLAYAGTIFVLLPAAILSGLAISPGMDAAWPWLLDLFQGRQSARSIHFITAAAIAGFVIVHLVLVILAGVIPELLSMITGRWRIPVEEKA